MLEDDVSPQLGQVGQRQRRRLRGVRDLEPRWPPVRPPWPTSHFGGGNDAHHPTVFCYTNIGPWEDRARLPQGTKETERDLISSAIGRLGVLPPPHAPNEPSTTFRFHLLHLLLLLPSWPYASSSVLSFLPFRKIFLRSRIFIILCFFFLFSSFSLGEAVFPLLLLEYGIWGFYTFLANCNLCFGSEGLK